MHEETWEEGTYLMGSWANISERSFRGSSAYDDDDDKSDDDDDDDEKDNEDTSDKYEEDSDPVNWFGSLEKDMRNSDWGISSAEATLGQVPLFSVTLSIEPLLVSERKHGGQWLFPFIFDHKQKSEVGDYIYISLKVIHCFSIIKFTISTYFILYCSLFPFRCSLRSPFWIFYWIKCGFLRKGKPSSISRIPCFVFILGHQLVSKTLQKWDLGISSVSLVCWPVRSCQMKFRSQA